VSSAAAFTACRSVPFCCSAIPTASLKVMVRGWAAVVAAGVCVWPAVCAASVGAPADAAATSAAAAMPIVCFIWTSLLLFVSARTVPARVPSM
jgi:hypothetical protein